MSCTRTVWLIDTENIPKKWVKTVYFKTKRDKLIIFLGPEATCMSLKELQVFLTKYPANQVEFCNSNAGKNSMDFHIAAAQELNLSNRENNGSAESVFFAVDEDPDDFDFVIRCWDGDDYQIESRYKVIKEEEE